MWLIGLIHLSHSPAAMELELVGSPKSGPPYSASKLALEHSVVAVAVVAVVVPVVALITSLLAQHWGAQGPQPEPAGRGPGGQRVCHMQPRAAVLGQVKAALVHIPSRVGRLAQAAVAALAAVLQRLAEDKDEFIIVSLPTSVLNPIVVSRLSKDNNRVGPGPRSLSDLTIVFLEPSFRQLQPVAWIFSASNDSP